MESIATARLLLVFSLCWFLCEGVKYKFVVQTGWKEGAGTDGEVWISFNDLWNTRTWLEGTWGKDDNERGSKQSFVKDVCIMLLLL